MYVCCDLCLDSFATQISQILADLLIAESFVYNYTTIYLGCNCVSRHWHADFTDSCRLTPYDDLKIMSSVYNYATIYRLCLCLESLAHRFHKVLQIDY